MPYDTQVGAPRMAYDTQVGAPWVPHDTQVGAPRLPHDTEDSQVGAPSMPHDTQVGAPRLAHNIQVGAPTVPHDPQVGARHWAIVLMPSLNYNYYLGVCINSFFPKLNILFCILIISHTVHISFYNFNYIVNIIQN